MYICINDYYYYIRFLSKLMLLDIVTSHYSNFMVLKFKVEIP